VLTRYAEEIEKRLRQSQPELGSIEVQHVMAVFDSTSNRRDKDNCFTVPDDYLLGSVVNEPAAKLFAVCKRSGGGTKRKLDAAVGHSTNPIFITRQPSNTINTADKIKKAKKSSSHGVPGHNGEERKHSKSKKTPKRVPSKSVLKSTHQGDYTLLAIKSTPAAQKGPDAAESLPSNLDEPSTKKKKHRGGRQRREEKKKARRASNQQAPNKSKDGTEGGEEEHHGEPQVPLPPSQLEEMDHLPQNRPIGDESEKERPQKSHKANKVEIDSQVVAPLRCNEENAAEQEEVDRRVEGPGAQQDGSIVPTVPNTKPSQNGEEDESSGDEESSEEENEDDTEEEEEEEEEQLTDNGDLHTSLAPQPSGKFDNAETQTLNRLLRSVAEKETGVTKGNKQDEEAHAEKQGSGEQEKKNPFQWQKAHEKYRVDALIKLCRVMVRDAVNADRQSRGLEALTAAKIYKDPENRPDWWPLAEFSANSFEKKDSAIKVYNAARTMLAVVHGVQLEGAAPPLE